VTATVSDAFGNPTPGITVRFSIDTVAAGDCTTGAAGTCTFTYTGPNTPDIDAITAYADTDGDSTRDAGEPSGAASKTWVPGPPATLVLSPAADSNPVGTDHTVTATVSDAFGNPTPGITVRFTVTGSVTASGDCTTGADGTCTFTYSGPELPGADAITAYADTDGDSTQDLGEPSGAASKAWVFPASTPLCEIIITEGGWIVASNGDRASFGGNAKSDGAAATSGEQRYTDHGPVQPIRVHSINVLAVVCSVDRTQADIYGEATIDGAGSFFYKISVTDIGEPGNEGDRYRILLSSGYDSGDQGLRGGNVQIRDVQ
jgi:hypothetical protein